MIDFSLAYPSLLILVPCLIGGWYYWYPEKIGFSTPNPLMRQYLRNPIIIWILWGIRVISVTLIIMILARPTLITREYVSVQEPRETTIIFDISRSMLAEDISPNRLTIAKNALRDFLSERSEDSVSVIIFAGKAFLTISRSTDLAGILQYINTISPSMILQEKAGLSGTNIGDAILLANQSFSSGSTRRSIILITDGNANIGSDPMRAAEMSREDGIVISTIGIGTQDGKTLYYTDTNGKRVDFMDTDGSPLVNDLDEEFLQKIAITTGGEYYSAKNSYELAARFALIDATMQEESHLEYQKKIHDISGEMMILIIIGILSDIFCRMYISRKYIDMDK